MPNKWVSSYRERTKGIEFYGWKDVKDALNGAPIVGCDMTGQPVRLAKTDSPHTLISMGSGGGKSVTARSLLAQGVVTGAEGIILDFKVHSHHWAREVPEKIVYAYEIEAIHETLCALAWEGQRRNLEALDHDGQPQGKPIIILMEEMNATIARLIEFWRNTGGKNTSPAIIGFREILAMGRAANLMIIAIAQRASTQAMAGGDARENFATRILSRYTKQTWNMLANGSGFIRPSTVLGRAQVIRGDEATETQILYLSDEEAIALCQQ